MSKPDTDYITCLLLDQFEVGDSFIAWPLHITLVPWCVPNDIAVFEKNIANIISRFRGFFITIGEQRIWGTNTVNVIQPLESLQTLHNEVLELVELSGKLLVNKQYTGENYTPHVTHQKTNSANEITGISLTSVYFIARNKSTHKKTIITKLNMSSAQ